MADSKKKVAILGGGVGAMSAAFQLTQPAVRDDYEVTVYQLGWRLGGKGASGRNPAIHDRIEEHGPHVWSGVYDNAFRTIRATYEEMGRAPGTPLATWQDAFKPMEGGMTMMEEFDGEWVDWTSKPIGNDQLPGEEDASLLLPFWSYVGEALQVLRGWFRDSHQAKHAYHKSASGALRAAFSAVIYVLGVVLIETTGFVLDVVYHVVRGVHRLLGWLGLGMVSGLIHWVAHLVGGVVLGFVRALVWIQWRRVRSQIQDKSVRMNWIFLNFATGVLRGIHKDDVLKKGFSSIDHLEFREWLSKHIIMDPSEGAPRRDGELYDGDPSLTLNSPLALFIYHADFGYENGDSTKPRFSAGAVVHTLMRLAVTWKGALIWHMQAGMGDVIFAPFYEVLRKRGVKFEFFSKVTALHPTEDGRGIGSVSVARQVELAEGQELYEPLVMVKGLPCWPSSPLWDQLKNGRTMEAEGVDLEEWHGPEVDSRELLLGHDFDEVVLGISLGGIPYVCEELIEARPEWKNMVEQIGTVRTQSTQLWLDVSTWDSGWEQDGYPTVSCYDTTNLNEWADFSFLIDRESWSAPGDVPKSIAYLTGPMQEDKDPRGRKQGPEELDKESCNQRVRALTADYMNNELFRITGNVAKEGSFAWERLVDHREAQAQGEARLDSQYCRANVQPTERYVLSLPGTTKYRLHPGDSKFDNLALAGDWTWSPFNSGCVEGATISGMLAANAICGSPSLGSIVGLTFGYPDAPYDVRS